MKTSELTGVQLDWAVAKCEGIDVEHLKTVDKVINFLYFRNIAEGQKWRDAKYHPSTSWAQGGPIIEREKITIDYDHEGPTLLWEAKHFAFDGAVLQREYGPTPLIAAMRCYVASKMGDEVEIPKELL